MRADERYVVVSSDCHAGGQFSDYREYLESKYLDEYDEWAAAYDVPYEDLQPPLGERNWDSTRREADMHADGVAGEVIYPNTIPPFFPKASLTFQPPAPNAGDRERRWAGLQAHNRWLVDFCAKTPGRRAGICQIMVHDLDAAVAEIRWARDAGLFGGVLMPGTPPGSGLPPLHDRYYDPLFAVCAELGMPLHMHGGGFNPPMADTDEGPVIFMLEVTWWGNRNLAHLVVGGALERHPALQVVFTEQGTAWIPPELQRLDYFFHRMRTAKGSQEYVWGQPVMAKLPLSPSEYFARQCHVGASFIRPSEVPLRHQVGVKRIMWGTDYPHKEATTPYTLAALRASFAGLPYSEVAKMVGQNALNLFGFDRAAVEAVAAEIGPTAAEVDRPLVPGEIPAEAEKCPALVGMGAPA